MSVGDNAYDIPPPPLFFTFLGCFVLFFPENIPLAMLTTV